MIVQRICSDKAKSSNTAKRDREDGLSGMARSCMAPSEAKALTAKGARLLCIDRTYDESGLAIEKHTRCDLKRHENRLVTTR